MKIDDYNIEYTVDKKDLRVGDIIGLGFRFNIGFGDHYMQLCKVVSLKPLSIFTISNKKECRDKKWFFEFCDLKEKSGIEHLSGYFIDTYSQSITRISKEYLIEKVKEKRQELKEELEKIQKINKDFEFLFNDEIKQIDRVYKLERICNENENTL